MSSQLFLFLALLLTGQWASGQELEAVVSGGFRQSSLHWSIAGNSAGRAPNIYSELRWRRVGGAAVDAALRYGLGRWVIFGEGSRVFTSAGRVSDRDYAGDNRTQNIYSEEFSAKSGYGYAVGVGAGYRLWPGGRVELVPAVGYGVSGQHLTITDPGGVYSFLNSTYQTSWFGPFVRASAIWRAGGRWRVTGKVTYHQVDYRAKADWNLIADFSHPVSFRHRADGFGVEEELGVQYRVGRRMEILLAGDGALWETGTGIDELYHPDAAAQRTQLNEVVLNAVSFRAGVSWRF